MKNISYVVSGIPSMKVFPEQERGFYICMKPFYKMADRKPNLLLYDDMS